jgi:sugar-specific transcriptional regulator TrmB
MQTQKNQDSVSSTTMRVHRKTSHFENLSAPQAEALSSEQMVSSFDVNSESEVKLEVIRDPVAVGMKLREILNETQLTTSTFGMAGLPTRRTLKASESRNEEMFKRGVRSRTVYLAKVRRSRTALEYVQWLNDRGSEVRTISSLPLRMIISDDKIAIVPIDQNNDAKGIVVIRQPSVLTGLVALFETIWTNAQRIYADYPALREAVRKALFGG